MKKPLIILTACVNPGGMIYTALQDAEARRIQYETALRYYLDHTDYPIVICENSGCDFSAPFHKEIEAGRLEFLTFDGNDFDKSKGKGYGEAKLVRYIMEHSRLFRESEVTIKITGRVIVPNIKECLCQQNSIKGHFVICDSNAHLTAAPSRFVVAYTGFYEAYFMRHIDKIDDSKPYTYEMALADAIVDMKRDGGTHRLFAHYPIYEGISGTSGTPIKNKSRIERKAKYWLSLIGLWGRRGE